MNCSEYENLITEYLENKASPSQRVRMESHLVQCEKCRALAKWERLVMEQLNEIPIEQCPDEIIDHLMDSISLPGVSLKERIRKWLQFRPSPRYKIAFLAGSLAIVILLLFLYIPGQKIQKKEVVQYSPEEIRQATIEARLALAYFSVYSRKTETTLEKIDLIKPVIRPIEDGLKKALEKIPYI